MPLYTYIATYRGGSYVEQERRSNFRGFAASLVGGIPEQALPDFKAVRKDAVEKIMRANWTKIANRQNVWSASVDLEGGRFVLYSVQTAS